MDLQFAEPAEEAIGGKLGDPQAALRARLQVLVYKLGRSVIKLTEAVGRQSPVGRMRDWMSSHRIISGDGSTKRH